MGYNPQSYQGRDRDRGALRGDQVRIAQDAGTRLDMNKPIREWTPDAASPARSRKATPPGKGMRIFGHIFAWMCGFFFLGVLAITFAWALNEYYDRLFIK